MADNKTGTGSSRRAPRRSQRAAPVVPGVPQAAASQAAPAVSAAAIEGAPAAEPALAAVASPVPQAIANPVIANPVAPDAAAKVFTAEDLKASPASIAVTGKLRSAPAAKAAQPIEAMTSTTIPAAPVSPAAVAQTPAEAPKAAVSEPKAAVDPVAKPATKPATVPDAARRSRSRLAEDPRAAAKAARLATSDVDEAIQAVEVFVSASQDINPALMMPPAPDVTEPRRWFGSDASGGMLVASQGVMELNTKMLELFRIQSQSAVALWAGLCGVTSLSEAVQLQTSHMRKHYEETARRAKDIAATAQLIASASYGAAQKQRTK